MSTPQFVSVAAADVSVVICCYTEQRWDDTLAAIASVQRQSPQPREIVVVVDHNEALLERMRAEVPGVVLVANTERQGLAGARNCGVAAATGEVIAFLDDDATARRDWLAQLCKAYDSDVIGVGGGVVPRWPRERPDWFPVEFDWVIGCSYRGLPQQPAAVRNFIGANMSLRREAFGAVGGFSHELGRVGKHPAGCEETELCIRATRAFPGSRLVYVPDATVDHRVTAERLRSRYFMRRCFAEGISKSVVARLTGAEAALETERAYVRRVLPAGVLRGLRRAGRGKLAGLGEAAAIVLGVLCAAAGYSRGKLSS